MWNWCRTVFASSIGQIQSKLSYSIFGSRLWGLGLLVAFFSPVHAQIQFQDVTNSAGPFHTGESRGATWCDINSDGFMDILAANHRRPTSAYRNNGDGTFTEVSRQIDLSGVWRPVHGNDTHGIACVDFDNDGDQDILHSTGACCKPYFLVNNGGLFTDQWASSGMSDDGGAEMPSWFDFTRDGRLDLTHHSLLNSKTMRQTSNYSFTNVTGSMASGSCQGGADMGQLSDIDNDGDEELICIRVSFADDAFDAIPVPWLNIKNTLPHINLVTDSAIADFDGDLEPDFFLTRGRRVPSQALKTGSKKAEAYLVNGSNQDKGFTFQTTGVLTVVVDSHQLNEPRIFIGSNGHHPIDTDNKNGTFTFQLDPNDSSVNGIKSHTPGVHTDRGVYIGYFPGQNRWEMLLSPTSSGLRVYITARSTSNINNVVETGFEGSDGAYFPAILINNNGNFTNQHNSRGFNQKIRCNSGVPGDFDNDGDVDLYVVCRDGVENIANRLYVNNGSGNFTEDTNGFGGEGIIGSGVDASAGTGDVAVVSDYDNDGRLDLFVTNGIRMRPVDDGGGPDQLFRNTTSNGNKWILLDLVGAGPPNSNRDGIGAKVFVTTGGKTQLRQQNGKFHRWSQDDKRIHFGIGSASSISQLKVEWPSGIVDQFNNVTPSKRYRVHEGGILEEIGGASSLNVNVSDANVAEEDGTASFNFSLSGASNSQITIDYMTMNGSALAGQDYSTRSGTITFHAGQTQKTRTIPIIDDDQAEATETFSVVLSNPQNAVIGDGQGIGTITDGDSGGGAVDPCGDPNPNPSADKALFIWKNCSTNTWYVRAMSGNSTYAEEYLGGLASSQSFTFVNPFNLQPSDFVSNSPSSEIDFYFAMKGQGIDGLEFKQPQGAQTCFGMTLLPIGAQILVGAGRTPVTEPFDLTTFTTCALNGTPSAIITGDKVSEDNGEVTFTAALTKTSSLPVTIDYETEDDTAVSGLDYLSKSGSVTFNPGEKVTTTTVTILNDVEVEDEEKFIVELMNPQNAVIGRPTANGTILDDDSGGGGLTINVSSETVLESDGTVKLSFTLSDTSNDTVKIRFATANGSALAGQDYSAKSGTITFNPGQTQKKRSVNIINDSQSESTETFTVNLSNPQNVNIGVGVGTVTVNDDDGGSGGVDPCGDPGANAAQDFALFVWRDCGSGEWHVEAMTGNASTNRTFSGEVVSNQAFMSVTGVNLDSNDTLVNNPATHIGYTLRMKKKAIDGFNFEYPSGASVCFDITSKPGAADILIGGNRTPVSPPFDLVNFESCSL